MAITAKVYGLAIKSIVNKEVDWDSDTIKGALCASTHTPNQDTHQYASSLTNELTGGGYARQTITGKTVVYDGPTNTLTLDCADITFPGVTTTDFRYLMFIDTQTGSDATSPLVAYTDFGALQTATAQDIVIGINASGAVAFVLS
jgi:hypothetical protein